MLEATVENAPEFAAYWIAKVVRPIGDGLRKVANRAAREGAKEARERHQFQNRSGSLEKSIGAIVDAGSTQDQYGAEIVALEKYASFVENGTRPHEIRARRVNALRFVNQSGITVYRRVVKHPGGRAFPFMSFAYFKAERVLLRESEMLIARVAQELLR